MWDYGENYTSIKNKIGAEIAFDAEKKERIIDQLFKEKNNFWKNEVLINLHDEAPKEGGLLELRNTETKAIMGAKLLGKLAKTQSILGKEYNS